MAKFKGDWVKEFYDAVASDVIVCWSRNQLNELVTELIRVSPETAGALADLLHERGSEIDGEDFEATQ